MEGLGVKTRMNKDERPLVRLYLRLKDRWSGARAGLIEKGLAKWANANACTDLRVATSSQ